MGQILNVHPLFNKLEGQGDAPSIVERCVLSKVQRILLEDVDQKDAGDILSKIYLYGPQDVDRLSNGYGGLEYNLYKKDLNGEGIEQLVDNILLLRIDFINRIYTGLYDIVVDKLKQANIVAPPESINYLIANCIYDSMSRMSIPESLLQKYKELDCKQEPATDQMNLKQEFKDRLKGIETDVCWRTLIEQQISKNGSIHSSIQQVLSSAQYNENLTQAIIKVLQEKDSSISKVIIKRLTQGNKPDEMNQRSASNEALLYNSQMAGSPSTNNTCSQSGHKI